MSFYIFCKNNIFRGDIAGSSYRKCGSTVFMHSISTVGLYSCKISFWHFDFSTRLYARICEQFCASFRILSYRRGNIIYLSDYHGFSSIFYVWNNHPFRKKIRFKTDRNERDAHLVSMGWWSPCEEMPVIIRLFRGLFILLPWFFYTVTVLNIA